MTDQSTRDPWTRPTRTLERANIDQPEPDPSTQDSAASDLAAAAQEHRGVAAAASPGGPVEHLDKAGVVAGGHAPIVPASVGGRAAPEVSGPGELLPGDVPVEPVALFDGAATQGFRGRWQQLQLRFIDDPHTVATQAGALADEVVTALRDAVDQQRTTLEDWQSDHGADAHSGDTERLRVAVRRYRDFVDRLLAM